MTSLGVLLRSKAFFAFVSPLTFLRAGGSPNYAGPLMCVYSLETYVQASMGEIHSLMSVTGNLSQREPILVDLPPKSPWRWSLPVVGHFSRLHLANLKPRA